MPKCTFKVNCHSLCNIYIFFFAGVMQIHKYVSVSDSLHPDRGSKAKWKTYIHFHLWISYTWGSSRRGLRSHRVTTKSDDFLTQPQSTRGNSCHIWSKSHSVADRAHARECVDDFISYCRVIPSFSLRSHVWPLHQTQSDEGVSVWNTH